MRIGRGTEAFLLNDLRCLRLNESDVLLDFFFGVLQHLMQLIVGEVFVGQLLGLLDDDELG